MGNESERRLPDWASHRKLQLFHQVERLITWTSWKIWSIRDLWIWKIISVDEEKKLVLWEKWLRRISNWSSPSLIISSEKIWLWNFISFWIMNDEIVIICEKWTAKVDLNSFEINSRANKK